MAVQDHADPGFDEIAAKIKEPQERVLAVAAKADGEIPTGPLRTEADIPRGSTSHYLDPLVEWGLLEITGTQDTGNPIPSNVYQITDRGRQFLERPSASTWASGEDVQQLADRIDGLQKELRATQVVLNEELGTEAIERVKEVREQL